MSIKKGDFVGILGHNGSGKSTLAKQLAALLKPSGGIIYVNGMDTAKDELLLPIRKTAGMVFQNPDNQLIGNIVEEDIAFGPENMGIPREEIEERITRALEATGMSAYREHLRMHFPVDKNKKSRYPGCFRWNRNVLFLMNQRR